VATTPGSPWVAVRASPPGRVVVRFVAVSGYDRALALATQAFVAVVPMLIVVTAAVPGSDPGAVASWLPPAVADAARPLVRTPETTATVTSAVLLVVSVVGFTRTLQRTYVAAWELPGPGWRGLGAGLLGAAVLVGEIGALVVLAPAVGGIGAIAVLVLRAAAGALVWWTVLRLLLGGRVGWRPLLPGAGVTGIGQAVVMTLSGLVLPDLIERESARFGLIGVAFVLVSVLVVLGLLLVFSAVLGAELARPTERGEP
jgi:membrane protein